RVVPAIGVTIARRVPVIRLKSVDLPTLGRPTRTTEGRGRGIGSRAGPYGRPLQGSRTGVAAGLRPAPRLIGSVGIAEPDAHVAAVGQRDLLDEGDWRSIARRIPDHRIGLADLEEP